MSDPDPSALVECRNLSFGYGERRILDNVSFTIPRGKVTALMGASGGGKTTTLRLLGGQVRAQGGQIDPATGRRHFSVCASESTVLTLLIDVLKRVEKEAPGVTVELLPADPAVMAEKLARRELDFTFGVEGQGAPDHPQTLVIHDTFHCAVWTGNKRARKALSLDSYLAMGHAITRYGFDKRPGFEQFTLQRLGVQRRVEVSCTTPALLGPLVVGTQRVATLPTKLANQQAEYLPLRLFVPPLDLPPLRIVMQWHKTREHDGATAWFRDLVVATSRDIGYQLS